MALLLCWAALTWSNPLPIHFLCVPYCCSVVCTAALMLLGLQGPVGFVQSLHNSAEIGRYLPCEYCVHICGVVLHSAILAPVYLRPVHTRHKSGFKPVSHSFLLFASALGKLNWFWTASSWKQFWTAFRRMHVCRCFHPIETSFACRSIGVITLSYDKIVFLLLPQVAGCTIHVVRPLHTAPDWIEQVMRGSFACWSNRTSMQTYQLDAWGAK